METRVYCYFFMLDHIFWHVVCMSGLAGIPSPPMAEIMGKEMILSHKACPFHVHFANANCDKCMTPAQVKLVIMKMKLWEVGSRAWRCRSGSCGLERHSIPGHKHVGRWHSFTFYHSDSWKELFLLLMSLQACMTFFPQNTKIYIFKNILSSYNKCGRE